jgi:glycosyltransferase involved in cell wall biosynthesis
MEERTIGIITYKVPALKPWDPDTIRTGITGSEEAVIYVSQKLADLGFKVVVFSDPPSGSLHSLPQANPRFVPFDFEYPGLLDVAISWRMPQHGRLMKQFARKVFLWPEDVIDQRLPKEMVLAFDGVLWVSEWQRQQWMSFNPEWGRYTTVFGNAINPEEFSAVEERENPYSCIYGSNYARGLEIMLDIWPAIKTFYPRATLDIYYGWQHWGCLTRAKEEKMRRILPALQDVREHGLVGHAELNRAYQKTSFWTYPCIMPETFCTTAIRAQMGGAVPVIIEGSALSETVRHGYKCKKSEEYLTTLVKAMDDAEKITLEDRGRMSEFVLKKYTWQKIASGWKELF